MQCRHPLSEEHKEKISKSLRGRYTGQDRWSAKPLKETWKERSNSLAYILGVLMGDGYLMPSGVGLETKDADFARAFEVALENQFGRPPRHYHAGGGSILDWRNGREYIRKETVVVRFHSVPVRGFLQSILSEDFIRSLGKEEKSFWLRGLWDSEGSITRVKTSKCLHNKLTSKDLPLLKLYQEILKEVTGIESKISGSGGMSWCYFYDYGNSPFVALVSPSIGRKCKVFKCFEEALKDG